MKPEAIEALKAKGFVLQADGSWSKVRGWGKNVDAVGAVWRELGDPVLTTAPVLKRVRQSSKPLLNKLESEFFSLPWARGFLLQAVRFRLGNGIWYKPDGFDPKTQIAVEVKGPHAFRGGFENLKVAASLYPMIRWRLVWKQDGQWQEQEILP
jgi:hypothetical protein